MLWLDAAVHWLHLTAAITWVGGMIFTAFVLGPVLRRRLAAEARLSFVRELGLRFKRAEWACLAVLALTGARKLSGLGDWTLAFEGGFGRILIVKLLLVAAMAGMSFLHSFVWGPRLAALPPGTEEFARLSRRLVFWARINLLAGLAVILCAALLRTNPL